MRALLHGLLVAIAFTPILSAHALQPAEETLEPPDDIEEVVVSGGKTLSQWRLEVERAEDQLVALFNKLNEGEDNDVRCRNEAATGTRIPQRVCWSQAQDRASATGARDFLNALVLATGSAGGESAAQTAAVRAMSNALNEGRSAEDRFQEEWGRVLGEDQAFGEAVAEYAALKAEFDRLTGSTSSSGEQPRLIALGSSGPQCEASTYTEYEQRDDVARISGTVSLSMCPAGTTGSFTLVANVRDEAGAISPLEFSEAWRRADAQDHVFSADYPIGENVALVSVRVRNLTCSCVDPAQ